LKFSAKLSEYQVSCFFEFVKQIHRDFDAEHRNFEFPIFATRSDTAITVFPTAESIWRTWMYKNSLKAAIVSAMLAVGVASYAQSGASAHASIPFEFVVNGTSFPAGNYNVAETSNPRIAILRNTENPHISCIIVLRNGQTLADRKAEFTVKRKSAPEQAGYQAQ
jgi:hypothetical protein